MLTMQLSSRYCQSSPAVHLPNADSAPGGRRPSNRAKRLELRLRRRAAAVHICHRSLLLLLSPKADTHFTRVMDERRLNQPIAAAVKGAARAEARYVLSV